MHKYAIIVAGGKGERMGANVPKQFLPLKGKPILMHTIERFNTTFQNIEIILVLPKNQIDFWAVLCQKHQFTTIPYQIIAGGKTRFHSVKNALTLIKEKSVVAIHDGVRPLVSSKTIKICFSEAEKKGNAIPVVELVDSLRYVSKQDNTNKAVTRSCYKIVQTPQCFKSELILKAYQQNFDASFTDDASVIEKIGEKINLVNGNRKNIKITTHEDLIVAEVFIKH